MERASNGGNAVAPESSQSLAPRGFKIDPITALQESIDGLSLAMFEALRGLRDAVAPESGNLGVAANNNNNNNNDMMMNSNNAANGNNNNNNNNVSGGGSAGGNNNNASKDVEELYRLYCNGDEDVVALVNDPKFSYSATTTTTTTTIPPTIPPLRQLSDFIQWHERMEQVKDAELVERLAAAVLAKSREIDDAVEYQLPGLHRTRTEQMEYLQQLIQDNAVVAQELAEAYQTAQARRDQCRTFIIDNTSRALGID